MFSFSLCCLQIKTRCSLVHLESAYKLLAFHKVGLIHESGKDPFEAVSARFHERIDHEESIRAVENRLRTNQIDGKAILSLLFDVIQSRNQSVEEEAENVDYP